MSSGLGLVSWGLFNIIVQMTSVASRSHWLRILAQIEFRLAVLVYCCLSSCHSTSIPSPQSVTCHLHWLTLFYCVFFIISVTVRYEDKSNHHCSFTVADANVWNNLPPLIKTNLFCHCLHLDSHSRWSFSSVHSPNSIYTCSDMYNDPAVLLMTKRHTEIVQLYILFNDDVWACCASASSDFMALYKLFYLLTYLLTDQTIKFFNT